MKRSHIISLIGVLVLLLGLASWQTAVASVPPGTDPNHPLSLKMGLNAGNLGPEEERWFSVKLHKSGPAASIYVPLTLSLYFTPNMSNPPDRVHLDLFDADAPRIWSAGYPHELKSFGSGTVRALDQDDLTGEKLWQGALIDDTLYYIRLRNDNDFAADFLLCTVQCY